MGQKGKNTVSGHFQRKKVKPRSERQRGLGGFGVNGMETRGEDLERGREVERRNDGPGEESRAERWRVSFMWDA